MNDLFDIQGKVAVVTGGRKGIGKAIVGGLIEHGAKVVVIAKSPDAAELNQEMKAKYKSGIKYLSCDLSHPESRKNLGSRIFETHEKIDFLVNNAGNQYRESFLTYAYDQWEMDLQLLLSAVFDVSQQVARIMKEQGRGGRIINIGSISSFQGANQISGYVAAKHGLIGLTKSLAVELAPYDINVNCIAPGFINTELLFRCGYDKEKIEARIPKHSTGRPEDIWGTVLYLCAPASRYVTGVTIPVDGGWLAR